MTIDLLPPPKPASAPHPIGGIHLPSQLTPTALLYLYSPEEWEVFVGEVVTVLEAEHVLVRQLGGPYDGGLDVCGFLTDQKLQGQWHCYQCKHYEKDLEKQDVCEEITKLLNGVVNGDFILPEKYYFVSPKGIKTNFLRTLSDPKKLKSTFLGFTFRTKSTHYLDRYGTRLDEIRALAESIDFSIFRDMSAEELLALHRKSPYHHVRFALPLPSRPQPPVPPATISPAESVYVRELLDVYEEHIGTRIENAMQLPQDSSVRDDFTRHRIRFYSAEALRVFSRDRLPPDTFDTLADEIYFGVIDTLSNCNGLKWDRLRSTLTAAAQLQPTQNPILQVTSVHDKQGICHQLVNANRLTWRTKP